MELTQEQLDERAALLSEGFEGEGKETTVEDEHTDELEPEKVNVLADAEDKTEDTQKPEGTSQDLLDTLKALQAKVDGMASLEDRLRKSESRVGNLYQKLEKANAEKIAAPSPEEIKAAAEDEEANANLKEEWPEWAEALERTERKLAGSAATPGDIQKMREEMQQTFDTGINSVGIQVEKRLISMKHRDWEKVVTSDGFVKWGDSQDAKVKALIDSNHAEDVIEVVSLFKDSQKGPGKTAEEIDAKRKERLTRSAKPTTTGKSAKNKTLDDMTPEEQRRYLVNEGYKEG